MERRTRIVIADDDARIRRSLRALVQDLTGLDVVAEAEDGEEAIRAVALHQPDIVLMDFRMPRMNGLEATARLKREAPHARVIIVSVHSAREFARHSLRAGARGYVSKDTTPAELETAIRVIARGGVYIGSHEGGQATIQPWADSESNREPTD